MEIANEADFVNAKTKLGLQKISAGEIVVIDIDDIYDGPLSGSCSWRNREYYFFTFDRIDDTGEDRWPRKYLLITLTPQQLSEVEKLRNYFRKRKSGQMTREEYSRVYDDWPKQVIKKSQIIGWFDGGGRSSQFMGSYRDWSNKQ